MYNAVLRACRVQWCTSSATQHHLTAQPQSRTMVSGKLSRKKKTHRARTVRPAPPEALKDPPICINVFQKAPLGGVMTHMRSPRTSGTRATRVWCVWQHPEKEGE